MILHPSWNWKEDMQRKTRRFRKSWISSGKQRRLLGASLRLCCLSSCYPHFLDT
uniref:Uncharacterized protein n=1 Tax=Zea mays TaxID=4577 RepID=B6SNT1_MAIZE|nr:hypothetical protein [Zea mays]ACG48379.1 hypothetical protein [Zea mays]